jgi:8-oxo-dGTP diphosphatase
MPYTPILATLGYVLSPDRESVLLIHRNARLSDPALGKFNGLGGKIEPGEDIAAGMKRELLEEAGISATQLLLRGTISWPGFGKNGEDWFGFIFLITEFTGTVFESNPEGTLSWQRISHLLSGALPLWPGDYYFLPSVFDFATDPRSFHGVMPYETGAPVSWQCTRL